MADEATTPAPAGAEEGAGTPVPAMRASRRERRAQARAERRAQRSGARWWRWVAQVAVVLVAAVVVAALLAQNAGALHLSFLPRPQH